MNQREKDIEAALSREDQWRGPEQDAFADGAEYARKELFERLRAHQGKCSLSFALGELAKEYGL